jgi:predicted PurR-regulated permease PerM
MNKQKTELYFLGILLLIVATFTFFIFKPFLFALILATVFATVFDPFYRAILSRTKNRESLSAFISTLIILLLIIVPLTFIGLQIFKESVSLYTFLGENSVIMSLENALPTSISEAIDIDKYFELSLAWLVEHLTLIFTNVAKALVGVVIFLISVYYLFKERVRFKKSLVSFSPLQDVHDEQIFNKLALAVNSVVRGNLTVALIQGILTALGFFIFGVPNPTLWGALAAIFALVPSVGTSIVLAPAVVYLYLLVSPFSALGLLIWGVIAVGLVDNILGPKFVSSGVKLHPFLILLSTLGGITFWGPIGFILGPLILSLFFSLVEIYLSINPR